MAHLPRVDRTQPVLLPDVLNDFGGPDNPMRFLDAFVAQVDLGALGFQRAVRAETGRPSSPDRSMRWRDGRSHT
jgi:transposase